MVCVFGPCGLVFVYLLLLVLVLVCFLVCVALLFRFVFCFGFDVCLGCLPWCLFGVACVCLFLDWLNLMVDVVLRASYGCFAC